MYKAGDKIVYPMHGVGKIADIEEKEILGQKSRYYMIDIIDSGMKVMIPVEKSDEIGIRKIVSKNEIAKVIDHIINGVTEHEDDWKIRYQNNIEKVKSGSIFLVSEVARDLFKRGKDKELSIMERKLYESAYKLIIHEVAMSKDIDIEEAENIISEALSEA